MCKYISTNIDYFPVRYGVDRMLYLMWKISIIDSADRSEAIHLADRLDVDVYEYTQIVKKSRKTSRKRDKTESKYCQEQ